MLGDPGAICSVVMRENITAPKHMRGRRPVFDYLLNDSYVFFPTLFNDLILSQHSLSVCQIISLKGISCYCFLPVFKTSLYARI